MLRNSCKASHSIIVRTWEYNLYIFSDVFLCVCGCFVAANPSHEATRIWPVTPVWMRYTSLISIICWAIYILMIWSLIPRAVPKWRGRPRWSSSDPIGVVVSGYFHDGESPHFPRKKTCVWNVLRFSTTVLWKSRWLVALGYHRILLVDPLIAAIVSMGRWKITSQWCGISQA